MYLKKHIKKKLKNKKNKTNQTTKKKKKKKKGFGKSVVQDFLARNDFDLVCRGTYIYNKPNYYINFYINFYN